MFKKSIYCAADQKFYHDVYFHINPPFEDHFSFFIRNQLQSQKAA